MRMGEGWGEGTSYLITLMLGLGALRELLPLTLALSLRERGFGSWTLKGHGPRNDLWAIPLSHENGRGMG
jgi:hypothetical protein